jgi:hypothetical protein
VNLREIVNNAGDGIEAAEIEIAVLVVVEKLLSYPDLAVKCLPDMRLIEKADSGRENSIIYFARKATRQKGMLLQLPRRRIKPSWLRALRLRNKGVLSEQFTRLRQEHTKDRNSAICILNRGGSR